MAEDKPDLEEIAQRLSELEDNLVLKELDTKIGIAYQSIAEYKDEKGRTRFRHDFSEEPEKAKELADNIFDVISEHIHNSEYDMDDGEYKNTKGYKSKATGTPMHETHAHLALGLSRHQLRLLFDKQKKNLSLRSILGIIQQQLQDNYLKIKQEDIFSPLTQDHVKDIKGYIGKKIKEHKLPKKDYDVKGKELLDEVKPTFYELAKTVYGK